jgi:hypothetical protein
MAMRGRTIERRNPRRSPFKDREGFCGVCGEQSFFFNLIPQRGTLVDRTHSGCYDDPLVFQGTLTRPLAYGDRPE